MTEDDLREANGLLARFYYQPKKGQYLPHSIRWGIQWQLSTLGVHLDHPVSEYRLPNPDRE